MSARDRSPRHFNAEAPARFPLLDYRPTAANDPSLNQYSSSHQSAGRGRRVLVALIVRCVHVSRSSSTNSRILGPDGRRKLVKGQKRTRAWRILVRCRYTTLEGDCYTRVETLVLGSMGRQHPSCHIDPVFTVCYLFQLLTGVLPYRNTYIELYVFMFILGHEHNVLCMAELYTACW